MASTAAGIAALKAPTDEDLLMTDAELISIGMQPSDIATLPAVNTLKTSGGNKKKSTKKKRTPKKKSTKKKRTPKKKKPQKKSRKKSIKKSLKKRGKKS